MTILRFLREAIRFPINARRWNLCARLKLRRKARARLLREWGLLRGGIKRLRRLIWRGTSRTSAKRAIRIETAGAADGAISPCSIEYTAIATNWCRCLLSAGSHFREKGWVFSR